MRIYETLDNLQCAIVSFESLYSILLCDFWNFIASTEFQVHSLVVLLRRLHNLPAFTVWLTNYLAWGSMKRIINYQASNVDHGKSAYFAATAIQEW